MYKLTVIAGPNRGTSFPIQLGENLIGRQAGNQIVLSSAKVSKRHCSLTVTEDGVVVRDHGSSNGTFINGVLARERMLRPGDRVSVGEFVLELVKTVPAASAAVPALAGMGNGIQFPASAGATATPDLSAAGMAGSSGITGASSAPTDLVGKVLWNFDKHVMPIFWGLNQKREWKLLLIGLFATMVVGNLVLSVYPLLESSRVTIIKEANRRARFMAKQIVERNTPIIASGAETRTDIGSIENEDGVRVAMLVDLDSRIIAPGAKMNQYLSSGVEAAWAIKARNRFRAGKEEGFSGEADGSTVVAIEPVKVLNPQMGRNQVVGMAVVSLDTGLATPDLGEIGVVYSETHILTGNLAALFALILYRMTLKPLEVLNDDIDKVLKGDMTQVTHEFKFEELDSLWDVINSALQRVPRGGSPSDSLSSSASISIDEYTGPLQTIGAIAKFGLAVADAERKIVYLSPMFEEITGIRNENAVGQDFNSVARDQSMGPFITDIFDRCSTGVSVAEDYDFSGISYKVHAASFGPGGQPRAFILAAVKADG